MRHPAFFAVLTLLLLAATEPRAAKSQSEFSIYCSSNMDGTGKCRKVESDEVVNCIIIPGGVVACKDTEQKKYECVQYGAITANQTQFACVLDTDNSVNDQLFEDSAPKPPDSKSEPSQPEKPSEQEPTPEPTIPNPFQTGPSPDINDNDFPAVF